MPVTLPDRRTVGALLLAVAAFLLTPGILLAHSVLKRSVPSNGAHLTTVPVELRLTFTEAVELAVTKVELLAADGTPVPLAPLVKPVDSATVVIAGIQGVLRAGTYTVAWQTLGADGHPVRGRFAFTIEEGAEGLSPEIAAPADGGGAVDSGEEEAEPVPAPETSEIPVPPATFDASSPSYSFIRWLTFVSILAVTGAIAFRCGVVPLAVRGGAGATGRVPGTWVVGAAAAGLAAAVLLIAVTPARLVMQAYAVNGGAALDLSALGALVGATRWGAGWVLQAAGSVLAAGGFLAARRERQSGWVIAAIGAAALVVSPAISGHAAAARIGGPWAILSDALHVAAAGGWMGSLAMMLAVGIPAAMRLEGGDRVRAVSSLVHAFSPLALTLAGIVVASGSFAMWLHVGSIDALFGAPYGRILLWKLAAITIVVGAGAYNFLRVRPALRDEASVARLRRSATFELAVGIVVVAVTAVLVATGTPGPIDEAATALMP